MAEPAEGPPGLHRDPHERRFVAVLFADLVGSTRFADGRDPEIVRAALTTYFDRAQAVIARFGGTVEKFIGDAVMAVWGAIIAHEDDAERAVRAGLELTDAVSRIGDELGEDLAVRVGVLTGEASVAPATPERGFVVGDLVNTASRLQSIAAPGTVVVGGATYRMLRHAFQFEALGDHSLQGKATPVAAWRVVRPKADRTRSPGGSWESPFVGRVEELRLLKDALDATERAAEARLISIVGEPGIGKSRLVWELHKYADGVARDICWLEGRSPAYDLGLPFWSLGEMVRQRAGIAESDDPLRTRTKLGDAVAACVDPSDREWIELRLTALLGLDDAPTGEQSEFFAAVRSFFQSIADSSPTVLVFDDFQWADEGLVAFVSELVERSAHHPIMVVTLARPDILDRVPRWGSGRHSSTALHIGPLSDAEMTELVTGMVEGIGEGVVDTINDRADGIPLYAVELIRMLVADGALVMVDDAWCAPTRDLDRVRVPDTVRAVVEARLDRLPLETRSLLQDAAVLGAAFTPEGLAAMSGIDPGRLEGMLEPLVRRELLELEEDPRSPERGQYRFVQTMIQDVAYGRLTREERRVRHLRAAEFFRRLGEVELAGAVASHLMEARRVSIDPRDADTLAGKAASALSRAADRATTVHSHAQGLATVEKALAITTDEREAAGLRQRAARSASALARHQTAIDHARRALDWYQENGDFSEVAGAAVILGDVLCSAYQPHGAIEVLQPVMAAQPVPTDPQAVLAGATLARAYLMALRDAEAAETADRIIGPAERLELMPAIVDTLITRGTAVGNLGRLHEAIALLRGASRLAEEHDLPVAQMRAANNVGHLLAYDDHIGAMEACRTGMEQANRLGDVRFAVSFTWAVAAYLERDGRFHEAQELRDEVRDRFELPATSSLWYEVTDLAARVERGDASAIQPAYEAVHRSLDTANPQSEASVPGVKAKLDVLTGRFEAAYEAVMAVDEPHRYPDHVVIAAIAAARLGDEERLRALADTGAIPAPGRLLGSVAAMVSGALAALGGRTDDAVAGFLRALAFRHLRLDRANVQGLFATLVGRDVPEARQASDAAYAVFTEVGALAYLDLYAAGMPPENELRIAGV